MLIVLSSVTGLLGRGKKVKISAGKTSIYAESEPICGITIFFFHFILYPIYLSDTLGTDKCISFFLYGALNQLSQESSLGVAAVVWRLDSSEKVGTIPW
jgi:hypothetical protein